MGTVVACILLVVLLQAAVFATDDEWGDWQGPSVADTSPDSAPPAVATGIEVSLSELDAAASTGTTAEATSLEDVIDARVAAAQVPVDEQLETLSSAMNENIGSLRESASVIVSLQHPMPYDVFEQRLSGDGYIPSGTQAVTSYVETSSGYPFTFTDAPGADPRVRLAAMAESMTRPNSAAPPGDPLSDLRAEFREALEIPMSRWLVLGFSLPYTQYKSEADAIATHLDIAATEVDLNASMPAFKPTVRPVSTKWLGDLHALYEEGQ